jgi:L,D-transpeptidase catalytic domain
MCGWPRYGARSMRITKSVLFALAVLVSATTAKAAILVTVDKSTQQMTVDVDGVRRWTWPVSTGLPGHDTPSGNYTAFRMEADHYSKEWDDAPMPHSIFFTYKGHAIHGSFAGHIGNPASHGCVRLAPENAAKLYALVEQQGLPNTKVVLTGDVQVAMAHRGGAAKERPAAAARPAAKYAQRAYYLRAVPNSYYPGTYYSYQPYRYGY